MQPGLTAVGLDVGTITLRKGAGTYRVFVPRESLETGTATFPIKKSHIVPAYRPVLRIRLNMIAISSIFTWENMLRLLFAPVPDGLPLTALPRVADSKTRPSRLEWDVAGFEAELAAKKGPDELVNP